MKEPRRRVTHSSLPRHRVRLCSLSDTSTPGWLRLPAPRARREDDAPEIVTTVRQARLEICQWLTYYNARRRHSALNYLSPAQFEQRHLRSDTLTSAA
ncbi:integrase core domain-containing protein [Streptomyces violascens]|uniref:integrase core domain-containing protein n=1 Tax=Streptomyces violascens TaxID=67381 RepID=UPI00365FF12D